MNDISENLGNKRILCTVTTGRSGTHYLTRLLNYLPGIDVFHEEKAHPYHEVLRPAQGNAEIAREFIRTRKLPFINSQKQPIFAETSHLICKGFMEAFFELGITPDLIILTRDKRKIATSLFKLNTIPSRTDKGSMFYLQPDDPNVISSPGWQEWSDYQLCYWYTLEIERRAQVYADYVERKGGRVCRIDLSELVEWRGYMRLIDELDLRKPGLINRLKYLKNRYVKAGDFSVNKNERSLPENIDEDEKFIEACFKSGPLNTPIIPLPI